MFDSELHREHGFILIAHVCTLTASTPFLSSSIELSGQSFTIPFLVTYFQFI